VNPPPDRTDPPAAAPTSPPDDRPQYEFDAAQNQVLDGLAWSLRWTGIGLFVLAGFLALLVVGHALRIRQGDHLGQAINSLFGAALCYAFGAWFRRAAAAFARVTTTSGRDIAHLMDGLQLLRGLFGLIAGVILLYLFFLAVMVVALLVAGLTLGLAHLVRG
jgi:hypothetical protein